MTDRGTHDDAALASYLVFVDNIARRSPGEVRDLACRAQWGDVAAFDALVNEHLPLVVSEARSMAGERAPLADLIRAGNRGLIQAAAMVEARHDTPFDAFALWWIRECMLVALGEPSSVLMGLGPRVPRRDALAMHAIDERAQALMWQLGYGLCRDFSGFDPNDPSELDLGTITLSAEYTEEELAWERDLIDGISDALERLEPDDADMIADFFGINGRAFLSSGQIGAKAGLESDAAERRLREAINRLRSASRNATLDRFLR